MKVTFLGTAGGRFAVITQSRASGGILIEMDGEMIHVDPGPGALVQAHTRGVDLRKLTGIVISHSHPDHATDAGIVLEAMTFATKKKRGVVVGNEYLMRGTNDGHYIPIYSRYHLDLVEKYYTLKPGQSASVGKVGITATRTKHRDSKAVGFVFDGSKRIGYTSDTEYFPGISEQFRECDLLIINCLRPRNDDWPEHMNAAEAEKLIAGARPGMAVLTHIGMKLLRNVEREAEKMTRRTGIKTMAARDGMVLRL
jgi:phosphoribosyl 1,2-cyclic phosphodiesterase